MSETEQEYYPQPKLAWLNGRPMATGVIKQSPDDFHVREALGFSADGDGEHLFVRLRKIGCNTVFVAEQLAKFAKVPAKSVTYAGLKDRHAVTEQTFCVHLPGKTSPDFTQLSLEGVEILSVARNKKKLHIGNLQGNYFEITLREISDPEDVEQRLQNLIEQGFVNYFGDQRFGKAYYNIAQAIRWGTNEIQVRDKKKRGFYLSAARSLLFNLITSERIKQQRVAEVYAGDAVQLHGSQSWFVAKADELAELNRRLQEGDIYLTAPLPGEGANGSEGDVAEFENSIIAQYSALSSLLYSQRVKPLRRAMIIKAQELTWQWLDNKSLKINFYLPAGSFATSLIRELLILESEY